MNMRKSDKIRKKWDEARQDEEETGIKRGEKTASSGDLLGEGTGVKVHFLLQAGIAHAEVS